MATGDFNSRTKTDLDYICDDVLPDNVIRELSDYMHYNNDCDLLERVNPDTGRND